MKHRAGPNGLFHRFGLRRRRQVAFPVALRVFTLVLMAFSFVAAGCAHRHPVARRTPSTSPAKSAPKPRATPPRPAIPGSYVEEGIASWYGIPYHGRRAAGGEIYDMYALTAAHRTLAFHSVVRVINLQNGRKTEVRINDRGPFIENRIIDLSLAAARELDLVAAGIARVRLELLAGPNPLAGFFTVQVGAFLARENAERLRERLAARYAPVFIHPYDSPGGLFYRVRVGRLSSEEAARLLAEQLRSEEGFTAFVVRFDEQDSGDERQPVPDGRQA